MAKVIQVSIQTFQTEVMQEAESRPVVLTFASSQMPECAAYNATLEKLSSELDFTLGEIDLDTPDNMAFVQTFRIQSLPFVIVLSKGEMADAISGTLSEEELKKRLSPFFVSEGERKKMAIEEAVSGGNFAAAKEALEALPDAELDDHMKILLAKCELGLDNAESAKEILRQIPENGAESANAKALLELMDLFVEAAKTDAVEGDAKSFRTACRDASRKDYRSALEEFFKLAVSSPDFRDGAAKKSMLILFNVLGPKDPLTWEYRSKLNTMLFV